MTQDNTMPEIFSMAHAIHIRRLAGVPEYVYDFCIEGKWIITAEEARSIYAKLDTPVIFLPAGQPNSKPITFDPSPVCGHSFPCVYFVTINDTFAEPYRKIIKINHCDTPSTFTFKDGRWYVGGDSDAVSDTSEDTITPWCNEDIFLLPKDAPIGTEMSFFVSSKGKGNKFIAKGGSFTDGNDYYNHNAEGEVFFHYTLDGWALGMKEKTTGLWSLEYATLLSETKGPGFEVRRLGKSLNFVCYNVTQRKVYLPKPLMVMTLPDIPHTTSNANYTLDEHCKVSDAYIVSTHRNINGDFAPLRVATNGQSLAFCTAGGSWECHHKEIKDTFHKATSGPKFPEDICSYATASALVAKTLTEDSVARVFELGDDSNVFVAVDGTNNVISPDGTHVVTLPHNPSDGDERHYSAVMDTLDDIYFVSLNHEIQGCHHILRWDTGDGDLNIKFLNGSWYLY